jgi:hypothetical protein
MNVAPMNVTQDAALEALKTYKAHRNVYDKRDWEIERIYRQIAKGHQVISVEDAIRKAGVDELGRPKLAIMRADQKEVICDTGYTDWVTFKNVYGSRAAEWCFRIPWRNRGGPNRWQDSRALLPRIPPQFRPAHGDLSNYHLLWEADWTDIPRDPYLLKRLSKDAWVVLAAWDLTDVEVSVLRAQRG